VTITVVGIGLDGKNGLTQTVQEIIDQARVLAGSKRHLSYFVHHPAQKINLDDLQTGLEAIAKLTAKLTPTTANNHGVVILTSGDPLFFGLGRLLLERFQAAELEFYPHLSSIQLAFNRLKIPWQDAQLISVHGRSTNELIKLLQQGQDKIALLTDGNNHPGAIALLYLALALPVNYSFYVCEDLEAAREKITHFPPEAIVQLSQLTASDFSALNVLILVRTAQSETFNLDNLPLIGLPDSSFLSFSDRPSLITKKEVRLAILGELALQPEQVVWDIGAGTGSVSIEIARLCPTSQILAIEKTTMGSTLIAKNSRRFKVDNIQSINGKAPDVLENLPSCDRIFIGGSGGKITDILHTCSHKLKDEGLIVMAFATIEYQLQAIDWLKNNNWQYRLIQLQISRSIPLNHLTRLTPLNPVTIITAKK
jgi:precorrin-6B C5,15-methyltransferase / cobalt-precorrin-6B C5,C15-methyltransferase